MQKYDGLLISESSFIAKPKIIHDSCDITIIETILQEAEAPNRNNRIYSKISLMDAINSPMVQEKLRRKWFVGEAGHPMSADIKRQTYIDQTRISHIVTEAKFDGNLLKGVVENANTVCGKDFQGLCRQGMDMAFSMRGLGGVAKKEGGYDRIDGKLFIISYDWVLYPSHHNAIQTGIIQEDFAIDEKILNEGLCYNVDMDEFARYIALNSSNVRELAEAMKFDVKKATKKIDPKNGTLDLYENGEILKTFVEKDMKREIDDLFKGLKF